MDLLNNLIMGLETALAWQNMLYCLLGVILGTAIGILPGLGPITTIALLLPITFGLPATAALIMLAGIYYGAQYGGSTAAILVNLPGESSAVVTAIDGYQLAKKGKAGHALAIAAIGSFVAGTIATVLIAVLSPPLSALALSFGPADYFALMLLGLIASVIISRGSLLHALGMILLGLLLGTVGTDINTGIARFTFGEPMLFSGLDFVVISVALFGIGEIIANIEAGEGGTPVTHKVGNLFPSWSDLKRCIVPILRGTGIGSLLGILPGGGAMLGSFAAYAAEKKLSPNKAAFGHGALEGVAAPEAANNAGAQTSFIPMLTLGIPSNPVMALMIGAMIIQGIQPGPAVMTRQPELFWGIIASMWVGNFFLLILNLPLIGLWVRLISAPYRYIFPMIVVFCVIGAFSISNASFEVYLLAGFGVLGYVLRKIDCEPAPLILAFVLGPMIEEYLRRALLLSGGDPLVFLQRPISASLLACGALLLLTVLLPSVKRTRAVAFEEEA